LLELTPGQVGALSQRVLQRHFGGKGDEPGGAPLHSPFQRYLRLKQRFEFEPPSSAGEA
jgi:hypothetical protein